MTDAGSFNVHLIDGTYELFRQHYGQQGRHGKEIANAATIGVLTSTLQLMSQGATHVGVASDHVIESFRNDMWSGYKSSAGMDPELLVQIPLVEQALIAMGVTTWCMVEHEADDALGAAAKVADADPRVRQVQIVTPDKDLGQCVRGTRVVQYDRRKDEIVDEAGVIAKFGVPPSSIADYLGLVGDTADGFPGLPGWGAKGASAVLAHFGHIENIPDDAADWGGVAVRGAAALAATLRENRADALLFREIATVVTDIDVGTVDSWRWTGPTSAFEAVATALNAPYLHERAVRMADALEAQTPGRPDASIPAD